MAVTEYNISNLFSRAFGYEYPGEDFKITKENLDKYVEGFKIDTSYTRPVFSKKGQPFYATDDFGVEFFLPVWLDDYLVPFAVISINCKKTIITTPLPERGGSVKELISIDDYVINIKGMAVNYGLDYPEDQIQTLFNKFKINKTLKLRSALTDIFLEGMQDDAGNDYGHRVAVKSLNFPANPGVEHVKPFELDLESDTVFELILQ